jgi:hypothetical protein
MVIQQMGLCMSTAIVRAVERCFSLIAEGDEIGSSMLVGAGSGRAEI